MPPSGVEVGGAQACDDGGLDAPVAGGHQAEYLPHGHGCGFQVEQYVIRPESVR